MPPLAHLSPTRIVTRAPPVLAHGPQARDIDLNTVFADCFTASEMDLFSSQLQEYVGDAPYYDGMGQTDIGENPGMPI